MRKPTWPPGRLVNRCSTQRSPLTPRKVRLNTVEPTRMKMTKDDSFAVVSMAWRSSVQSSRRLSERQDQRAGGAHGAALGRRGDAEEDRAEHEEDQDQRRHQREDHAPQQREAAQGARLRRQRRRRLGLKTAMPTT